MKEFPRTARLYIWTLAGIAGGCLVLAVFQLDFSSRTLPGLIVFSAASAVAGLFPVAIPRRRLEMTPTTAVNIAAVILFPFSLAVLIPVIGALATEIRQRRIWYKSMFNMSHVVVVYLALHLLYQRLMGGPGLVLNSWSGSTALLVVGLGYYFLDTSLVVAVVALTGKVSFWSVWQTSYRSVTWHQISMVCTGFLLAFLWTIQPSSIVLIILPVIILRQALSLMALLENQTYEAIEVLVDTIDARDSSTHRHSERVAFYSRAIAEKLGLEPGEVEQITVSARLHDLGKVGISDAWLYKPGPLTPDERAEFQRHSALGAQIVERFPILGVERRIVRSHHERWDGYGYPDGLSGEQIPLGARIIAVADAFDAMTSDRPYRKGLSYGEARRRLHEGAGSQFDPVVVAAALDILPREPEPVPILEPRRSEPIPEKTKSDPPPVVMPFSEQIA